MAGPHVFGNGRVGLWIVNPSNLTNRIPKIRSLAGGMITDLFLPRTATKAQFTQVRNAGFTGAHLWVAVDNLNAMDYAERTITDIATLGPGACELNIELGIDAALQPYMQTVLERIRQVKPSFRLRLNVAPFKGQFLPMDLIQGDRNLYVAEQTYYGDMSRVSEAEALEDLLEWGTPLNKASLCYGGAALVPVQLPQSVTKRMLGLGSIWTWSNGAVIRGLKRGAIFQDDLLAEVGLL